MRAHAERFSLSFLVGAALAIGHPAAAVTFEWITVGDPGNAADTVTNMYGTTHGSVPHAYRISKYEVTNTQYAEFLNAVAVEFESDFGGFYSSEMGSSPYGGITRDGSLGSFSYSVKPGYESKPVNFVSFLDAVYFANWLEQGQPVQEPGEPPVYLMLGDGAYEVGNPSGISRHPDATFFLPSENEWYKAAYYDGSSSSYFQSPTGSNSQPSCTGPTTAPNSANCDDGNPPAGDLVPRRQLPRIAEPVWHVRPGRERVGVDRNRARARFRSPSSPRRRVQSGLAGDDVPGPRSCQPQRRVPR